MNQPTSQESTGQQPTQQQEPITAMNEPTPPSPDYEPPQPFERSMESWTAGAPEDWANTVSVRVVSGYDPAADAGRTDTGEHADPSEYLAGYADAGGQREFVEIDTNYKPSRPGQHPV